MKHCTKCTSIWSCLRKSDSIFEFRSRHQHSINIQWHNYCIARHPEWYPECVVPATCGSVSMNRFYYLLRRPYTWPQQSPVRRRDLVERMNLNKFACFPVCIISFMRCMWRVSLATPMLLPHTYLHVCASPFAHRKGARLRAIHGLCNIRCNLQC